ncbi:hypothetical protein [Streptomyces clavifer]|uniref:hypothetical protein n=1 Tax=Streptomyces clavifer TaxID=68188 RepID=UPI003695FA99
MSSSFHGLRLLVVPGLRAAPPTRSRAGRYKGTATSTWTITWTAPALGDGGTFTESRQAPFTVDVREVQVVNIR